MLKLTIGIALFALSTVLPAAAQSYAPGLQPCKPEPTALCGKYRVFEDRQTHAGRTIDLNVVVLPAVGARRFDPLFMLEGGPGVGATGEIDLFVKDLARIKRA